MKLNIEIYYKTEIHCVSEFTVIIYMQEALDYLIANWEISILPTLLILCGIAGIIIKRTSTKKDDEVLNDVEKTIQEVDKLITEIKKSQKSIKKDDSTPE